MRLPLSHAAAVIAHTRSRIWALLAVVEVGVLADLGHVADHRVAQPAGLGVGADHRVDPSKAQILDLVWAMTAAAWLKGKRMVCTDADSMQMETALDHVHRTTASSASRACASPMKLFSDMIRKDGGYDRKELAQSCATGPPRCSGRARSTPTSRRCARRSCR